MLMGHKIGLKKSYFKPTDTEILEGNDKKRGYIAAIPALTIQITKEENEKLRKELKSQREKDDELKMMKDQVNSMQSMMEKLIAGLSNTTNQQQRNIMTKSLLTSGILKSACPT